MKWLDTLVKFAHANLHGSREFEELWSRGVSDEQASAYEIGYLDGTLPPLPGAEDFLEWSRHGSKLVDVFVLPLTNSLGQNKGVQFRHVKREVKGYMDYFAAKDEPVLFGLAQAMPYLWESQVVCLVEGAFDLFPVQRIFPGSVATLTSKVSGGFATLLKRTAREVIMAYDADKAGRDGTATFLAEYGQSFLVRTPSYPPVRMLDGRLAKDPAEFWEAMGDPAFGVYLKAAFDIR